MKAVLNVTFQAAGLPSGSDIRPALATLWLADEGILADVRGMLGEDFVRASQHFLLGSSFVTAALKAKSSLAPDLDTLMDRLGQQFATEPEPTVEPPR